jgi:hypothetical protein
VLFEALFGSNAAPTYGDDCFRGTYTVFSANINYASGNEATLGINIKPTDGGSVVPDWAVI